MIVLETREPDTRLERLISPLEELAVLPHVVFRLQESSGGESQAELERTIAVDPGFSCRVLARANSPIYGYEDTVVSIQEAVGRLGPKELRRLASGCTTFETFVGKTDRPSLRRRSWWRHSMDTAVCCRWLAASTGVVAPDEAYTCGLLHYLGKSLLDRHGETDYELVLQLTRLGFTDAMAEKDVYGYHHVELVAEAARRWGLPLALQVGLDTLEPVAPGQRYSAHRACTAAGSRLARLLQVGKDPAESAKSLPVWALEVLRIAPRDAENLVVEAANAIAVAQLQV